MWNKNDDNAVGVAVSATCSYLTAKQQELPNSQETEIIGCSHHEQNMQKKCSSCCHADDSFCFQFVNINELPVAAVF